MNGYPLTPLRNPIGTGTKIWANARSDSDPKVDRLKMDQRSCDRRAAFGPKAHVRFDTRSREDDPFATEPQWPRIVFIVYERITRSSLRNYDRRARGYWRCRPCHYTASLASDTGGVPSGTASARTCLAKAVAKALPTTRPRACLSDAGPAIYCAYYSVISDA